MDVVKSSFLSQIKLALLISTRFPPEFLPEAMGTLVDVVWLEILIRLMLGSM